MASKKKNDAGPAPAPKGIEKWGQFLGKGGVGAAEPQAPPVEAVLEASGAEPVLELAVGGGEKAVDKGMPPGRLDRAIAGNWLHRALTLPDGATPFPWQEHLLDRFLEGDIPRALDIPTGLGKTSVIAIWLAARALGAPVPRRLVYVVDRRAVVDQASAVAVSLRGRIDADPALKQALALRDRSLPISTLRGQHADNREWLEDPTSPAIVVGTVDMIGSRLLFEGYGVSRRMRPYHAGMLGHDTLVVLDEAHLVSAFEALLRSAQDDLKLRGFGGERPAFVPLFSTMSLSATSRRADGSVFRLTPFDQAHPIVRRRLDAPKTLIARAAVEPGGSSLADALAREAWALSSEGRDAIRCIVFCSSRADAQKTADGLENLAAGQKRGRGGAVEVELFVGGRRVHERVAAASWLQKRGFLAGHDARPAGPTFLVATSAGEVGVDLDADHMVSDVVAWERMVQRLGRVNRRGDGNAKVIVVPAAPDKKTREAIDKDVDKRKPEELALVRRAEMLAASLSLISELPQRTDGRDGSPSALVALRERSGSDAALSQQLRTATTPDPLHPALTRPLLEAWSMTSLDEHAGRPEVQPWIRGWTDEEPQTSIAWRELLPVRADGMALPKKELDAFLDAALPHTLELLETETYRAVEWLQARIEALPDGFARRQPASSELSPATTSTDKTAPVEEDAGDEHAVDEVLQDADDDEATLEGEVEDGSRVVDGDDTSERPAGRPLTRREIVAFVVPASGEPSPLRGSDIVHRDPRARKRALEQLERQLRGGRLLVDRRLGGLSSAGLLDERVSGAAEDVTTLNAGVPFRVVETTSPRPESPRELREELRLAVHASPEGVADRWLVIERPRAESAVTEEGRSVSRAQLLDEHEACAEKWAMDIARRLRLTRPYFEMLATAARLHDEGKKARRWQRAFHAPDDGVYGKTSSRPNIALLDGYRHELGSLPYAEKDPRVAAMPADLRDLCLHLIGAHHGHARPVIPTSGCEDAPPSALDERAREVALRFARLEKQWGPWGLAWWEVLLRAADQQASRENDSLGGPSGGGAHG